MPLWSNPHFDIERITVSVPIGISESTLRAANGELQWRYKYGSLFGSPADAVRRVRHYRFGLGYLPPLVVTCMKSVYRVWDTGHRVSKYQYWQPQAVVSCCVQLVTKSVGAGSAPFISFRSTPSPIR